MVAASRAFLGAVFFFDGQFRSGRSGRRTLTSLRGSRKIDAGRVRVRLHAATVVARRNCSGRPDGLLARPVGRSSNGKTAASGAAYRGSNPCLPAKSPRLETNHPKKHAVRCLTARFGLQDQLGSTLCAKFMPLACGPGGNRKMLSRRQAFNCRPRDADAASILTI